MKIDYTYDYIHGTDVYIYQHRKMFRINTDTALLAAFMHIKKGEKVLDIGTNNGALLAVANTCDPAFLYGVDIQEEAIALAKHNMAHHHIEHVELFCGDVCTLELPKVDVIVCNPPYFKIHEKGDNTNAGNLNACAALQIARHEKYLTLDNLCAKVSSLLEEKGRFYMVHRANRIAEIAYILHQHRLEIRTMQFVYDDRIAGKKVSNQNDGSAISVLVEAWKDGKVDCHVLPAIHLPDLQASSYEKVGE